METGLYWLSRDRGVMFVFQQYTVKKSNSLESRDF